MSAIAPKSAMDSPMVGTVTDKVFKSGKKVVGDSSRDLILEIIILTAAAVSIVVVTYLIFKPLFTGLFGTVTDTIGTITEITSDALGTITGVVGGVIEDASSVVSTVVTTTNTVINSISTTINTTLNSAKTVVETVGETMNTTISTLTSTTTSLMGTITSSFTQLMGLQQGIITEIVTVTENAIDGFKTILETASGEFQNLISYLRQAGETIVQSVQDGIRYIIDPFINTTYGIPAIATLMLNTVQGLDKAIDDLGTNNKSGLDALTAAIESIAPN